MRGRELNEVQALTERYAVALEIQRKEAPARPHPQRPRPSWLQASCGQSGGELRTKWRALLPVGPKRRRGGGGGREAARGLTRGRARQVEVREVELELALAGGMAPRVPRAGSLTPDARAAGAAAPGPAALGPGRRAGSLAPPTPAPRAAALARSPPGVGAIVRSPPGSSPRDGLLARTALAAPSPAPADAMAPTPAPRGLAPRHFAFSASPEAPRGGAPVPATPSAWAPPAPTPAPAPAASPPSGGARGSQHGPSALSLSQRGHGAERHRRPWH